MFVYASVALQACNRPTHEEEHAQVAHARSTVTVYAAQTKHSNSRPSLSVSWPLGNAHTQVLGTPAPFSVTLPSSFLPKLVSCSKHATGNWSSMHPPHVKAQFASQKCKIRGSLQGQKGMPSHLRQLLLHPPEVHIARPFQRGLCAAVLQQITQAHPRPVGCADSCGAPVEAHALLHYILLLPPVACSATCPPHDVMCDLPTQALAAGLAWLIKQLAGRQVLPELPKPVILPLAFLPGALMNSRSSNASQ